VAKKEKLPELVEFTSKPNPKSETTRVVCEGTAGHCKNFLDGAKRTMLEHGYKVKKIKGGWRGELPIVVVGKKDDGAVG
jgi:hypothetical protein